MIARHPAILEVYEIPAQVNLKTTINKGIKKRSEDVELITISMAVSCQLCQVFRTVLRWMSS